MKLGKNFCSFAQTEEEYSQQRAKYHFTEELDNAYLLFLNQYAKELVKKFYAKQITKEHIRQEVRLIDIKYRQYFRTKVNSYFLPRNLWGR